MVLLDALKWRYAVKKMNGRLVEEEKVNHIIEAARLAPSSNGLQPFKIIKITSPSIKQNILSIAYNQSQVVDCSHLLIFAGFTNYTPENIEKVFEYAEIQRGKPDGFDPDYKNTLKKRLLPKEEKVNFEHITNQVYLAFGLSIAAAAELKVDSTPMEGFNAHKLDHLLNLPEKGLKSILMLPLGYRNEQKDYMFKWKKIRTPLEDFVIEIK